MGPDTLQVLVLSWRRLHQLLDSEAFPYDERHETAVTLSAVTAELERLGVDLDVIPRDTPMRKAKITATAVVIRAADRANED